MTEAENLVQTVQNMLKEETWTRATISNYTQNNLRELANIVEKAKSENCTDELYTICQEHLTHSKDSIIALYLNGIFSLLKGEIDNTSLEILVDIFQKNHKEQIVSYLCENILEDDSNNKFALKTLAQVYLSEGNDKVWELYTQIVKIDFSEAELAKSLAEHYEQLSDAEMAKEYYKKAELRFINIGNYAACKEVWTKLIQIMPEEIEFFQLLKRKIGKTFGEYKTTTLMQELYNWYKDNKHWDIAISILKQNLEIEPKDSWARKELSDCYKAKFAGHSHLDEYIRSSNLNQNFRNVFEAINDFEKHIAFDKGCFVFHRNWGVGLIRKLEQDTLTINFGKTAGIHTMSLKMAVSALKPLDKDHIWVLKATKKREELAKMVKQDKVWALKTIIKSFDNNCDFKRIKAELVPSILTQGEWTSWNTAAKKVLDSDSTFGVNPNDINIYMVRENEISVEDKLCNEFKAQKQFFARIDILMKFINNDLTDKTSESFVEMYSYFTSFLKNVNKVTEQVIASYLIIKKMTAMDKAFAFPIKETFADFYARIEDPREIYDELKDSKNTSLKLDFINAIKMLPTWNKEYIRLFPTVLDLDMINELVKNGYESDVHKLVKSCFENFKDYRETVIFLFKNCQDAQWFKDSEVSYEKQLITLINIIELTFREITNHVNSTENKKINKNATTLLFEDGFLFDYMFQKDEKTVKKLYTLIDDISDIDTTYKTSTRNKILEKFPDFKFRVSEEKSNKPKGMFVTAQKLTEKKAEIEHIQNVELPENAKDIAEAREKGDLKENAEYHAAKDAQKILNKTLSKLQEELNRATVFDPTTITTAIVSFATVVTLTNLDKNKDEVYTILGPWESAPENNIISYMSPFGNAIMDKKVGDKCSFTINEYKYNYIIKSITKADI